MTEFNCPPVVRFPYWKESPKKPYREKIPMSRELIDADHKLWVYDIINGKLTYIFLASLFIEENPQIYKTKRGFKNLSRLWSISTILDNGQRMITVKDGEYTCSYIHHPLFDEPYLY